MNRIPFSLAHPEAIEFEFIRSSGPGGQNVNKVATAVRLRVDIARCTALPAEVRQRLIGLAGRKVDGNGVLSLLARSHRTQEANRRDALDRLDELIEAAHAVPKPRKPTRPTRAAKQRRLEGKLHRSRVKSSRRAHTGEDE